MEGQLQHHPSDCNHLQSRGRLPPRARPHFEMTIEMLQYHTANDNYRIARNDENGKPKRERVGPFAQAQRDDCSQQQPLICNGIKHGSKRTSLTEPPGDPSIQAIRYRSDEKDDDRSPPLPLLRPSLLDTSSVVNGEEHEDWDQQNPRNCDLVGQCHEARTLGGGKTRSQRKFLAHVAVCIRKSNGSSCQSLQHGCSRYACRPCGTPIPMAGDASFVMPCYGNFLPDSHSPTGFFN